MVKKLFKHEFLAYTRVMAIVYSVLLTIALATKIILVSESDTTAYNIICTFSIITYGVSVFATLFFAFAMGIIRFYKNLFTAEGYLTFTLPVTASQHILVKIVTAVCVEILSFIAVVLSGCIVTSGELLSEIWKVFVYLFDKVYALAGVQCIFIGCEALLLLLLSTFTGMMLYYTFISIGQLSKKNRILGAVGAFFIYYIITQVISSVFTVGISVLAATGMFERLALWISNHIYAFFHIAMWGGILLSVIFGLVEYFIIRWIITKKLNLE